MIRALLLLISDTIRNLLIVKPEYPQGTVIVSCDGSILKNPGGRSAVGAVIQIPGNESITVSQFTPATTNNEAEFDAIYTGLLNLVMLHPGLTKPVVVESDSKLVVNALNNKWKLKEPRLIKKRDFIQQFASQFPKVEFKWYRRNSTTGLHQANNVAQSLNGVKNH